MTKVLTEEYLKEFHCQCGSRDHTLVLCYYDDEEIYVQNHLTTTYGFWKRLWYAVRYILGKKSNYGCFEETVLTPDKVDELIDYLQDFKEKRNAIQEKEG